MSFKHLFKAVLNWQLVKPSDSQCNKRTYTKTHRISIEGKADLPVSAAKAFKGDPSLYNPEDLLLSSVVSCHMMSYLYCCAQHNIEVLSYTDHAEAVLEVNPDGSGRIIQVNLKPIVTVANREQLEIAIALHIQANKLCFIANSCNFPVVHDAICEVY